jgi:hypothetical protein
MADKVLGLNTVHSLSVSQITGTEEGKTTGNSTENKKHRKE